MNSILYLVDCSALIYAGNAVPNDDSKIIEDTLKFPVSGVRYALRRILGHSVNGEVIAVFDSKTDKKEYYSDYKAQREHNSDVFFQKELLRYILPKLGIKIAHQDNYEADDLIYSIIYSLQGTNKFREINIVSDDADVAGAIIAPNIYRIGATSNSKTVTSSTYPIVLKSNAVIAYNAILPYIMFYGKPSNNVKPIKHSDVWFNDFLEYSKANNIPSERLSEKKALALYLKHLLVDYGDRDKEFVNEIISRMPVVYPKLDGLKYSDIKSNTLDKNIASTYLSMFRETAAMTYLDVARVDPQSIDLSKFDKFVRLYRSGAPLVDNDLTTDASFEFTNAFGDNGINIRTF